MQHIDWDLKVTPGRDLRPNDRSWRIVPIVIAIPVLAASMCIQPVDGCRRPYVVVRQIRVHRVRAKHRSRRTASAIIAITVHTRYGLQVTEEKVHYRK